MIARMHNGQGLVIARLAEDDLEAVAAFEAEIARISFPDDPILDPLFHQRRLANAVGLDGAFLARVGGARAGWAWVAARENFSSKERYADFKSLYVEPAFRGGHVVFALMRACIDFCRRHGLGRIVGRTSATNADMQAVYRICGFTARHIVYELDLASADAPEARAATGAPARARPTGRRKDGGRRVRRSRGSRAR